MIFNRVDQVAQWRLCMGCGACSWACPKHAISLVSIVDKGIRPVINETHCEKCERCIRVCPGWNLKQTSFPAGLISELEKGWGPVLEISEGFCTDKKIRFLSSSGGASTAIALWALENGKYSGVLHTAPAVENPLVNLPVFSRSRNDLMKAIGSRYSPASVCSAFEEIKKAPGPTVFIGKPCDCAALRMAANEDATLAENIGLVVSIFCAGTPAMSGTLAILKEMGIDNPYKIRSFRYRGYGWPGEATVDFESRYSSCTENCVHQKTMSYERAWGEILTKHVQFRCRLCPDKTGEFADISLGDSWYRKVRGEGYSLILSRTEKGRSVFNQVAEGGFFEVESLVSQHLFDSQAALYKGKCQLWGRLLVMDLLKVPIPLYEGFSLRENWRGLRFDRKIRTVLGTLRRIIFRNWRKPEKIAETDLGSIKDI